MSTSAAWSEPGLEEVAEGVHRIPLPLPSDALAAVNVYLLLDSDGRPMLIDGGWHVREAEFELERALKSRGFVPAEIGHCLVTHHHRDHYSLALQLRRESGVSVHLGEGERGNLEAARSAELTFGTHRRRVLRCGAHPLLRDDGRVILEDEENPEDYEEPDVWVPDGKVYGIEAGRSLRTVATPGHTVGHVVFIDDARRVMFSGDHLLPHITPSVGLEPAAVELPLGQYLRSLAAVLEEEDMAMLPAHGPAGGSTHERATQLLEHHEQRLTNTEAAVRAGAVTAYEAASRLTWSRREHAFNDLSPFNQLLASIETLAHLDVLVAQKRLSTSGQDGVAVFTS